MATESLTSEQILKFRDEAFQKYFTDEAYLNYIEQKFGSETVLHILKIVKVKLKRKLLGD